MAIKRLCLLLSALLAGAGCVSRFRVDKELAVPSSAESLARGRYLANHVAVCMDCHSTRDWSRFSGPIVSGTLGAGGDRFDHSMNFPGTFYAPNITPHALGEWTDGEIYRAITTGVTKDCRPIFPLMPYRAYGRMATEDIHSIIAYLRSLPPLATSPPASKPDQPLGLLLHLIPKPAQPQLKPPASDTAGYGAYLVNAAGCTDCHTQRVHGKPAGEAFAGGFEFPIPGGTLRSANLTPHATGIGGWTRLQFIARFKAYDPGAFTPPPVNPLHGQMQTVMPWTLYAGMTEKDLGAIYDYLRTLPPVENVVERWTIKTKG